MRKTIIRISLSLVVVAALVFALLNVFSSNRNSHSVSASPSVSAKVPDVSDMPVVPVDAIPTVGGHVWRIVNDSNKELARCLTSERINFVGIHTLDYASDVPGARAIVSWITGSNAPSGYFTTAIQHCTIGAVQPRELDEYVPGYSDNSGSMAISGLNRSYATAAKVDAKMLLTFWTQPGAPAIAPSPANAMGFRALALYELAAMGVTNPEVIACPSTAVGPVVKVPPEVIAIIKVRYAKLAPFRISNQWSNAVDVKAESVTPHICVYADGRQVSYYGKVPTNATQAISVLVDHAPWPITGGTNTFVRLALIPNQGWIVIDEGSSP